MVEAMEFNQQPCKVRPDPTKTVIDPNIFGLNNKAGRIS